MVFAVTISSLLTRVKHALLLRTRYHSAKAAVIPLGVAATAHYWVQRLRMRNARPDRRYTLRSKDARHAVLVRAGTSDLDVFKQIFIEREYSCLDDVARADLIIDCGANVGYSSAYFMARFPNARLIAVEPDEGNFGILRTNLAPFGSSVVALRSAIWSRPGMLCFSDRQYRDGREWTRQVRPGSADEDTSIPAVDIGTLLSESGQDRISILKIDIEGAEAMVFAENYESWIDRVDNLVIELHDDTEYGECSAIFHRAIAGRGFTLSRSGELTVCTRSSARAH